MFSVRPRLRFDISAAYAAAAGAAALLFALGGLLLATTIPYHDWDSFAFGSWSKQIAHGGSLDPFTAGQQGSGRPLFYALQGALWSVTGVSFTAGRVLSLLFGLLLVAMAAGIGYQLARDRRHGLLQAGLAAICMVAVAPLSQETIAGKTDVPAAALIAATMFIALRRGERRRDGAALAIVTLCTLLTKATVVLPLLGLWIWLALERSRPRGVRIRTSLVPLGLGLLGGLVYDVAMALRFHKGLITYLETGTSEGLWAQRAAADRWHAFLRADVLGPGLRLPLTFAVVYALLRVAGVRHRHAGLAALAAGLAWSIGGPIGAGVPNGAFASADIGFAFVGFAVLLLAAVFAPSEGPSRADVALLAATGLPPLALWVYGTAYADRLASGAWPALAVLIAILCALGVSGLRRLGPGAALAPITVLAMAVWLSVATLDGFHGTLWSEYRSLGFAGVHNSERTLNIVLPSLQSTVATAKPYLRNGGKLSVSDPRFTWFLPGQVTTTTALSCGELNGYAVFVLATSDESEFAAKEHGGLATPEDWAKCRNPPLTELTDGSNGYAVFVVK